LLDNPKLIMQLTGLERRIVRSGRGSIDDGPGRPADVANAAAGALLSALNARNRGGLLVGTCGYGGPITWRDLEIGEELDPETLEPIRRACIRVVS
jgi:hypothetical protein